MFIIQCNINLIFDILVIALFEIIVYFFHLGLFKYDKRPEYVCNNNKNCKDKVFNTLRHKQVSFNGI